MNITAAPPMPAREPGRATPVDLLPPILQTLWGWPAVANLALGAVVLKRVLDEKGFNMGYDADTGNYTDLVEAGIVDPAKVTRTALQNAVSVATILLSTNCLVTDAPKKKDGDDDGGEGMDGMDDM